MHCIGEDRTERLRVIVTVRPKYACRRCAKGVTHAPAPAHLIEGGLPTEGAITYVLVSKYADGLPLYRQSKIMARAGVEPHLSTLADWVGTAASHLGIDEQALEVRAVEITGNDIGVAPVLPDLLSQISADEQIGSVTAGGAYDTRKCRDAIAERGTHAVIPPCRREKP